MSPEDWRSDAKFTYVCVRAPRTVRELSGIMQAAYGRLDGNITNDSNYRADMKHVPVVAVAPPSPPPRGPRPPHSHHTPIEVCTS